MYRTLRFILHAQLHRSGARVSRVACSGLLGLDAVCVRDNCSISPHSCRVTYSKIRNVSGNISKLVAVQTGERIANDWRVIFPEALDVQQGMLQELQLPRKLLCNTGENTVSERTEEI
jgi:hypothetical protein